MRVAGLFGEDAPLQEGDLVGWELPRLFPAEAEITDRGVAGEQRHDGVRPMGGGQSGQDGESPVPLGQVGEQHRGPGSNRLAGGQRRIVGEPAPGGR